MPLPAPPRLHRAASGFLTALATLAILVATLHPAGDELPRGWTLTLASGDAAAAEVIQNLLLFVPLGLALALAGWRGPWVVATGALLSLTVESLQQWIPGRDPSVGDIVNNTISTALGGALAWTAPRWLTLPTARAARASLAVALGAAAAWLGTGWLLRPLLPPTPYSDHWTPHLYDWGRYHGRVLSATLGPLQLQRGSIGHGDEARALLAAGAPLRIVAAAGPPPARRAPLVMIYGRRRVVFYVALAGPHLVTAFRTRASALTLARPELMARAALAGVVPGDTVTLAVWREDLPGSARYCLARDDARWCGLGHTMGDGWKLIFFPHSFPGWAFAAVNALWMAGWTIGVGWWGRRHAATGVGLAALSLTIALGPALVGLEPTPLVEIAGALGGLVVGWGLYRMRRRHAVQEPRAGTRP